MEPPAPPAPDPNKEYEAEIYFIPKCPHPPKK
jgi:hypothetical protein